jgi:outer membrane biosynthesis protein TonB
MEKCYTGRNLPEKLILTITLNADGTVKDVKVLSGTFRDNTIRQCVIWQVKKWQFPATTDGREVTATVTLVSGS